MRGRIAVLLVALLPALFGAGSAMAQSSPFDMSGERPAETTPVPQQPAAPAPAQVPAQVPAQAPAQAPRPQAPAPVDEARPFQRFVAPFERLTLAGETARRAWSIYLTPEEAAAGNRLSVGYQNAIFVAPEASRLRVSINGAVLVDEAIASPDSVTDIASDIAPGLLKPGYNLIQFEAAMRHRTDCSISSTYDLWTEIAPARTFLQFSDPDAGQMRRLEDIRALGVDATGSTRLTIVVPSTEMAAAVEPLVQLSQGLSLMASMPNQSVRVVSELPQAMGPGEAVILLGPANSLRRILPQLPDQAGSAATLDFLPGIVDGGTVMLVTGSGWSDVNAAIRQITAPSERSIALARTVLSYNGWIYPDAPFVLGDSSISLATLGVPTSEFSGRRFNTEFNIGIPSDFYAEAYGEARLMLDAAYSRDILPGSHLDIYVNGNIATTVPLGAGSGAILRQVPVNVTMRHFRPGLNRVAIEVVLLTESDAVCAPGSSAGSDVRFALFDTSTFDIPNFARIGTRPNLSALAGTGFPYNRQAEPVPVILDRGSRDTLAATATLVSRLALAAGRVIDIDTTIPITSLSSRNALFINTLPQVPVGVLAAVGIAEQARVSGGDTTGQSAASAGTVAAMNRWSSEVGTNWLHPVERLREWLSETFDLSFDALRLLPADTAPYMPAPGVSFVLAQGVSPGGDAAWTLATAATDEDMMTGMDRMVRFDGWEELAGRLVNYTASTDSFAHVPVSNVEFFQTQPLSYANLRLVAANALSENILLYAVMLVIFSIILGVTTTWLTKRLGRH